MRHVRPNQVFSLIPSGLERVQIDLPSRRFAGEPLMLEKAILLALLKACWPRKLFEFGTFQGATAKMFLLNSPGCKITTLDLPGGALGSSTVHDDLGLALEPRPDLSELGITQVLCDSNGYKPTELEAYDFIWIDGGHDLRTVTSDTENAYRMISRSPRSVIAWHDYGNPKYPELTGFLNELSKTRPLAYVEETLLVVDSPMLSEGAQ